MKVVIAQSAIRQLRTFPVATQKKSGQLIDLLSVNWRDSRLHTKKLQNENNYYSFRIGRDYRGIFIFEGSETIKILDIDHRKNIYR